MCPTGDSEGVVANAGSAGPLSVLLQYGGSLALAIQLGAVAALPHDWSVSLPACCVFVDSVSRLAAAQLDAAVKHAESQTDFVVRLAVSHCDLVLRHAATNLIATTLHKAVWQCCVIRWFELSIQLDGVRVKAPILRSVPQVEPCTNLTCLLFIVHIESLSYSKACCA